MEPPVKRMRVSKACQACHDRRVKCTFDRPGNACLHCRISALDCQRSEATSRMENPDCMLDSSNVNRFLKPQEASLPNFLRPLTSNLDFFEVQFLEDREAFSIPESKILSELIGVYFDHVNPFLPLFDESEFESVVDRPCEPRSHTGATGDISLLVLQAIIFCASAFVDSPTLELMGFNSREEARLNLYRRALSLHDLGLETDDVSIAQARLLLTHWVEIEDQRNPWYWMGSAISKIQSMDLRETLGDETLDRSRLGVLKRLWWSGVIRDTTLALGGRFIPRFRPEECDICMLEFGDFPSAYVPSDRNSPGRNHDTASRRPSRHDSITISIEMAKMSQCLNRILCVQSTLRAFFSSPILAGLGADQKLYRRLIAAEINACFRKVKAWYDGVHEDARWRTERREDQPFHVSDLGRILLRMAYCTAINCLYRPQVLPSDAESTFAVQTGDREYPGYCRKLLNAVQGVARCSEELVKNHAGEHLPSFSISFIIPAVVVLHARFRHSQSSSPQHKTTPGYSSCMLLLRTLRARYTCAERANGYLDRLTPGHSEGDESDISHARTTTESAAHPTASCTPQALPLEMLSRAVVNSDEHTQQMEQRPSRSIDHVSPQEHYLSGNTPSAISSDEHLSLLNQEFLSFAEHQRDSFSGTTLLDLSWIETDDFDGNAFFMDTLPSLPVNDFD